MVVPGEANEADRSIPSAHRIPTDAYKFCFVSIRAVRHGGLRGKWFLFGEPDHIM